MFARPANSNESGNDQQFLIPITRILSCISNHLGDCDCVGLSVGTCQIMSNDILIHVPHCTNNLIKLFSTNKIIIHNT